MAPEAAESVAMVTHMQRPLTDKGAGGQLRPGVCLIGIACPQRFSQYGALLQKGKRGDDDIKEAMFENKEGAR